MDPLNAPGYCIFVGIRLQHLEFLKEFAKTCLIDDLWLTLEAGGLEMVVSEVPVHFFHRCSTLLVMVH